MLLETKLAFIFNSADFSVWSLGQSTLKIYSRYPSQATSFGDFFIAFLQFLFGDISGFFCFVDVPQNYCKLSFKAVLLPTSVRKFSFGPGILI